jgi:hypothetical protein
LVRYPFCKAMFSVDNTGENNAAWAKATSSAGVAEPTVARAEWAGAGGSWGQVEGGGGISAKEWC